MYSTRRTMEFSGNMYLTKEKGYEMSQDKFIGLTMIY